MPAIKTLVEREKVLQTLFAAPEGKTHLFPFFLYLPGASLL
jgi:hypothetical protein